MEKTSKFKLLKFPSFFTSSCKTQNLDEVIDHGKNPIFTPQKPFLLQTPLLEKTLVNEQNEEKENYPFANFVTKPNKQSSLMCKPRCPKTFDQMIRENCIITSTENALIRRKVVGKYSMLSHYDDFSGRMCPPASPASPSFLKQAKKQENNKKVKKTRKRNNFSKNNKNSIKNGFNFSSSNETDYNYDLFSSDDEREELDDKKTMSFSSKSIISFSSESDTGDYHQGQTRGHRRPRRRKTGSRRKEVGVMPLEGKVKDTFAIVKSSNDRYNDFRTSMVEMIIEKQIFGAKELEQLLKCFLSLNSCHHHRVILVVFGEICDALFSHY